MRLKHIKRLANFNTVSEKTSYLLNLNYKKVLEIKGESFFVKIPALGISAHGCSYDEALKKLDFEKKLLFEDIVKTNSFRDIVFPEDEVNFFKMINKDDLLTYYPVVRDTLLLSCILIVLLVGAGKFSSIKDIFRNKVISIVNSPEEVKAQRLEKYKRLMREIRPYVQETRAIFE